MARERTILVADDQVDILRALRALLTADDHRVITVEGPAAALEALGDTDVDLALIDLNYARDTTSGREGVELLEVLGERHPTLPVVVMTAFASLALAVDCLKRGAVDFIEKPWDNQRLLQIVRTQLELQHQRRRSERLAEENRLLRAGAGGGDFIADSPAMEDLMRLVHRVAPTDVTLLVTGEHGTGKSHLARRIHDLSRRAAGPFVEVNVGAIAESVFESEIFGHVRGAFTDARRDRVGRVALAEGGTLFLDEVGNLSPAMQAKILHVLEHHRFEPVGSSQARQADVRIIAATNANLGEMVAEGSFREDLLYRLNTVELPVPPLRSRPEDVERLAQAFLARHGARYQRRPSLSGAARELLRRHAWPGNVRELDHVLHRAVLTAMVDVIEADDLYLGRPRRTEPDLGAYTLEEVEGMALEQALANTGGNVQETARRLGISRGAVYRQMKKHGLER